MTAQERAEAIERFQRELEAQRRSAEREIQGGYDLIKWKEMALPTINQSVQRVSVDFDALGSPFRFSSIPIQAEGSTCFRVKTKGCHRSLRKLRFDLADGQVTATVNVPCADFPVSVPVGHLTGQWVEVVAEKMLMAILDGA